MFTKSPVRENRTPGSVRGLPGNWQSYRDQLFLDHDHRSAQFFPAVAISALKIGTHSESRALAHKHLPVQRATVRAHSGQSRNFVLAPPKNGQFLPAIASSVLSNLLSQFDACVSVREHPPGAAQHREEMDHVSARLESRAQPLCHHLRKPAAG